jgi:hypothetical protein
MRETFYTRLIKGTFGYKNAVPTIHFVGTSRTFPVFLRIEHEPVKTDRKDHVRRIKKNTICI